MGLYSNRIKNVPRSFVREILKVTEDDSVISFAGGLPNPKYFPNDEIIEATKVAMDKDKDRALQYSSTEGFMPLRQYISDRYKSKGLNVPVDQIMIISGSQQAMDLIGKVFINEGDGMIIEKPGYLGAIQSFSMYGPKFTAVDMESDGICIEKLRLALEDDNNKVLYTVPNFQNPSGATYSEEKRAAIAELLKDKEVLFVEDDPYGELRFGGENKKSMWHYLEKNRLLLGSFSKIVAPGMRIGWIAGDPEHIDQLITAKQASDLQTSSFTQRVLFEYLNSNSLDERIAQISESYGKQKRAMTDAIEEYFPSEVNVIEAEGGMFLWASMPEGCCSEELFDIAIQKKVAFVPGFCFYHTTEKRGTMRLNYTNCDEETIREGIKRLGEAMKEYINSKK